MGLRRGSDQCFHDANASRRENCGITEELVQDLDALDPALRRRAARRLARYPQAVPSLIARLSREPRSEVREAIALALQSIGGQRVADGVVPLLQSDEAWLRNCAIEILQHLPAEAGTHIEQLLESADCDTRVFAINILETLAHPRREEWLQKVLRTDGNVNVVGAALNLLSEVASPASEEAVEDAARRFAGEPFIQFACMAVRERMGKQ